MVRNFVSPPTAYTQGHVYAGKNAPSASRAAAQVAPGCRQPDGLHDEPERHHARASGQQRVHIDPRRSGLTAAELYMAIENLGLTRLPLKQQFAGADAEDEQAFPREGFMANLGQRANPLPDSIIQGVRAHLEHVLRSPHFDGSTRSREFLRYVVDEVLAGRAAYLKQAAIAVEVFGRKPDFDAVIDPIVRVQAGRLRRSLERYYLLSGESNSLRIELPKGSYAPVFVETAEMPAARVASAENSHDWPTVVVHPIVPDTARDEAPCAQLREELTAELCRYGVVRVTRPGDAGRAEQPTTNARFELHGTARDAAGEPQFA